MFPRSKVQLALGDGGHHLAAHDRALEVRVRIVFIAVVPVAGIGLFGRQALEPFLKIRVQAALVVVDEYAGGDVHGVHQAQPLADAALLDGRLHVPRDVHQPAARRQVEKQFFAIGFHGRFFAPFFFASAQLPPAHAPEYGQCAQPERPPVFTKATPRRIRIHAARPKIKAPIAIPT